MSFFMLLVPVSAEPVTVPPQYPGDILNVEPTVDACMHTCLQVTSLLSYTRPERLSGDNKYFCDQCQEKQDALRSQTLRALPPVLIFSLNRLVIANLSYASIG